MDQKSKDTVFIGLSFLYMALRSRIVWGIVALLIILSLWRGRRDEQVSEEATQAADSIIAEHSAKQSAAPKPAPKTAAKKEPGRKFKVEVHQGFYFGPEFCEAVLTKFKNQHNRMPTNWVDIRANGGVDQVPPPRDGYKYVYDARLGIIEEVRKSGGQ